MKELSCDCAAAEIGPRHWKITRPASRAPEGLDEAMACSGVKAVAAARSDNFKADSLAAVLPRCRVAVRRRLKDTRAFVLDRLRHRLFPLKSGQLLQEPLVQALELLVRLLRFGSAVSFASQGLDRDALARQRCFLSRRRRLEQSYPRGKWVMHPCSNAERLKR